ncbi:MAG TPA: FUSC family protein [Acetobacteraceae bacterium]|nr:FUSC family protein [Acetobacteraceae bacterium]
MIWPPWRKARSTAAAAPATPGFTPRTAAPDLARLPIGLNLRAISLAEGLRAALSVAVILAINQALDWPSLQEAALGALWTCLCDPGGPIRRRVPVLLGFAALGAFLTAGAGLARGLGMQVALPLGAFGLFALSFARVYGQTGQQFGNLLCFALIFALDRPLPDLGAAATLAAGFLGGGLWATVLTLVIWQVHPYLPARTAVAEVYRRLAELVADLYAMLSAGTDTARWDAHAREHRRAVREAIEAARGVVFDTVRIRGDIGVRGGHSLIRLEAADQMFGALIALSDLAEQGTGLERRAASRLLRRLAPLLQTLGRAILAENAARNPRIGRSIDAMAADAAALPATDPLRPLANRIIERLRIAHTLALPENFLPGVDAAGRRVPLLQRVFQPVQANFDWRSPALRHALRIAVVATPALAFTMVRFNQFDHWLTITIVATMQPYFTLTYAHALERVGGTALGGLVAALVGLVCTTPLAIAGAMFPLSVLAFAVRAVSLGLFMAALTPLIVLLVETGVPGTSEWSIAAARFGFTTLGGIVAVVAGFALWPSWEPERLAQEARSAIGAHSGYADAALAAAAGSGPSPAVEVARRDAGLASNSLEASISRALTEPGATGRDRLEAALVIDAALRRCAGRLSAMQLDPGLRASLTPTELAEWRDWIGGSMRALAAGETSLPPRPTTGEADSLLRVARQIELMGGAMGRLAEPSTAGGPG